MNFIFETMINALEAFLILDFLARYFGFRIASPMRYLDFCIIWALSTASITFFSWNAAFESFSSLAQIAINIIFCIWLLRGNIWTKVFLSAFTMGGVILISSFTTFIIGHLSQYTIEYILTQFSTVRIIAIFTSKIIFFQVTRIILQIKENASTSKADIFPLIIIPIISIFAISLLTSVALAWRESQQTIFYAVCLIIILNLLTYYLFIRLSRSSRIKHDYELLNLQYECTKQNATDIQHLYENVRSIRHDMTNHLLCISNLLKDHPDNGQPACNYIQSLLKQQEAAHRTFVFSDNDALDAILNTKQSAAFQFAIQFDSIISNSLKFMSAEDICVLFGNLLDNAIAAAKKSEPKKIDLRIQPQGAYVAVLVKNSIDHSVLADNPQLETTKTHAGGHGYGIKNIKKVVQKYNGLIRFYEDGGQFISEILLLTLPIMP